MFRIYVINKVISRIKIFIESDDENKSFQIKRCLCWILGVSLLFYFFTKKDIVDIPVDRQEIINQSKTGQETRLALSVNEENINSEYISFSGQLHTLLILPDLNLKFTKRNSLGVCEYVF